MNDRIHYTSSVCTTKIVTVGEQIKHWVEYQLLDERGEPLANLAYRATNEASFEGFVPEFNGYSDEQGVIRVEGLHPIPLTLLMAADPLAELLQQRRLRAVRPEPKRPYIGDYSLLYGGQRSGFSPIEQQAHDAGHVYHYLRIGQLCDGMPTLDPPLADPSELPDFHFPDKKLGGFTVSGEQLEMRHVLEVCPFRAWSLVLHHQAEYSMANAYNLGLMSILAYSKRSDEDLGSVKQFFDQQCLDLSRTPRVWDNGQGWPCLVSDVPFNDRYTASRTLNTSKAEPPEGDTQLFYAISTSQVLVAWRGTEMDYPFTDLATDMTFRPVKPEVAANCEFKVPCVDLTPAGSVHLGFRDAYEVARRVYARDLGGTIPQAIQGRHLFICGHSLGGALGLIHAASLKDQNPLLYTYGMPRTFTLKAVQSLGEVWHFRHVNDTDIIPRVPPEAALDNYFYDLYGPMGTLLGVSWSLRQTAFGTVFKYEDPFCHHGEIAMFYRAEQHVGVEGNQYNAYRDPTGAPYHSTISRMLQEKAKLYLVPSLSEAEDHLAEQAQKCLTKALTAESRKDYFPRYGIPAVNNMLRIGDHFMSQYQPYIHNQLLELINPARDPLLQRQVDRTGFEQQMLAHSENIPKDEYARNRAYLELQKLMATALVVTQQAEGGAEALQRFDAVGNTQAYYEKVFG